MDGQNFFILLMKEKIAQSLKKDFKKRSKELRLDSNGTTQPHTPTPMGHVHIFILITVQSIFIPPLGKTQIKKVFFSGWTTKRVSKSVSGYSKT